MCYLKYPVAKYLGVILDKSLTYTVYSENLKKKYIQEMDFCRNS